MAYPYAGVLFDLDGTLLDTEGIILESFHHAVKTVLGRDYPDEVLSKKVGLPLAVQMWDFTDDAAVHDELLRTYRAYNEAIHDSAVSAFAGVADALRALHESDVRLGVVTSKRHALAVRGLEVCGVAPYLAFVIGSDDWETHKPDPGPVLHGCDLLGFEPGVCLYVGDSPYDLQAGNAAGCDTAAVLWGVFCEDALRAEHPVYVLREMRELLTL